MSPSALRIASEPRNSAIFGASSGGAAGCGAGAGAGGAGGAPSCAPAAATRRGTRASAARRIRPVSELVDRRRRDVGNAVDAPDRADLRDEIVAAVLGDLLDRTAETLTRLAHEELVLQVVGLETLVDDLLVLVDLGVDLVGVHLGGLLPLRRVADVHRRRVDRLLRLLGRRLVARVGDAARRVEPCAERRRRN